MDYKKIYEELNRYLVKRDKETFMIRFKELNNQVSLSSQEFVELKLLNFTYSVIFQGDNDLLLKIVNDMESSVLNFGNKMQKIKFYVDKGIALGRLNLLNDAIEVYTIALDLCDEDELKPYKTSVLINIGVVYNSRHEYITSLRYFLTAYNLNKDRGYSSSHTTILGNLGVIYLNINQFDKAIYYLELCLETVVESKRYVLPAVHNNLIFAYTKIKDFNKAKALIDSTIAEVEYYEQQNKISFHRTLAIYYTELEDYESAINEYLSLLRNYDKLPAKSQADYMISLVKIYLHTEQYPKSKELIDKIEKLDNFAEVIAEQTDFLQIKSDYYYHAKDYQSAYNYLLETLKKNRDNYTKLSKEVTDDLTSPLLSKVDNISSFAYSEKILELENINREIAAKEKLLVDSLNELKNESELRERIISIITHDIRSPIGNVIQLLEMLDEFDNNGEKEETILEIIDAMKQTFSLTNELVTWAKEIIEKKNATMESFYIKDVINNCELLLKHQLEKKHLIIHNTINSETEIFSHKATIETCFRNIISNAIKYSPEYSKIELSQEVTNDKVSFIITDFGTGMTEEQVKSLFDYKAISTLRTKSEDGIGIGLLLVKELVNKSKGEIICKSKLNEGTTFILTFPKIDN